MAFSRVVIEHPESSTVLNDLLNKPAANRPRNMVRKLSDYLRAIAGRIRPATVTLNRGAVKATATLTVSSTGSLNTETCTICNVTFTAVTSGATGNQFNINSTPATQAANMNAAFNASSNLSGKVVSSVNGAVVTLTSVVPGLIGNALEASESLTNVALVAFASGTDGSEVVSDLD